MHRTEEHRLEVLVGNLLRFGVILAGAVVLAGAAIYVLRHGSEQPEYATFHGEPYDLRTIEASQRTLWQPAVAELSSSGYCC